MVYLYYISHDWQASIHKPKIYCTYKYLKEKLSIHCKILNGFFGYCRAELLFRILSINSFFFFSFEPDKMVLMKEYLNKIFDCFLWKRWKREDERKKCSKKEAFILMNGTDPFCLCHIVIFNLDALSCLIHVVTQILWTCGTSVHFLDVRFFLCV